MEKHLKMCPPIFWRGASVLSGGQFITHQSIHSLLRNIHTGGIKNEMSKMPV